MPQSYQQFTVVGMALDPIHVGTGGARLGRVDLTIVRDPVTRVPKIPGSSLAGVYRSYAAMALNKYPHCAGQGQPTPPGHDGHCGRGDCPVCTVFGFARGAGGGFAGLAAFSDAHVLLFPVATRQGPLWVTCPTALRVIGVDLADALDDALYRESNCQPLNLGWLLLEVKQYDQWNTRVNQRVQSQGVPSYIVERIGLVSDKLFGHVVNSNLEVRTSVSINPETGAAEEGALFSYEALPRTTILIWDVTCKHPNHFQVGGGPLTAQINGTAINAPDTVFKVVQTGHPYLEHLGLGGMGTRGMGRLRVLHPSAPQTPPAKAAHSSTAADHSGGQDAPAVESPA